METTATPTYILRDLRDHCAFCRAACDLLRQPVTPDERAALVNLATLHQLNDQEREQFYRDFLASLVRRHPAA